jgi:acetolactate synthase I/III small subunit
VTLVTVAGTNAMPQHIFVAYVEDKPGVLNRVASLFRRRAFNIESLTVGPTEQPGISRMTIVVETDDAGARRVEANLYKLVNVLRVQTATDVPAVIREMALIKVAAEGASRAQVLQLVDVFRARVVDVTNASLIVEITGPPDKIAGLVDVLQPFGILEMARTGRVAMLRGATEAKFPLKGDLSQTTPYPAAITDEAGAEAMSV